MTLLSAISTSSIIFSIFQFSVFGMMVAIDLAVMTVALVCRAISKRSGECDRK
jgi:hypothetical protein